MLQTVNADTKKANARGKSQQAPQASDGLLAPPVPAGYEPLRGLHPRAGTQPPNHGAPSVEQHGAHMIALHRGIGNQAVLRMLNGSGPAIQAKLAVNEPGDAFEQQADRVADRVMRLTEPPNVRRKALSPEQGEILFRKCAGCEEEEKKTALHRKDNGAGPRFAPPLVQEVLGKPGHPLDAATRAFMEPRFGRDFSHVRIHSGAQPAESARAVAASAYTVGRDIVFDSGRYAPHTAEGRRLLAHELTHVVQQGSTAVARRVQRDLIYGSDYKNPYSGDGPETRSAEAKTWYPASIDFSATASGSGGGTGAASFDDLITTIGAKGKGSITSLGIIGHATTDLISLSGTITVNPKNVVFTGAGVIDSQGIKSRMAAITAVRDRFATGARIILYGCDAGVGDYLMGALSKAFQVCVQGFSDEVWWCIHWAPATRVIDSRGRTWVDAAKMMASGMYKPNCLSDFNPDIGQLKPDKKDCSGVATAPTPKQNATQPQGGNPESAAPETPTQQATPAIQTKLAVNTPGDAFEQEADHVADRVMRMADPGGGSASSTSGGNAPLRRKCSCGGAGGECAACAENREQGLQRSAAANAASAPQGRVTAPPKVHRVLSSPGQPLDPATRSFMEARFGRDFARVRVHTGSAAAESALSISALAFTSGSNIVFGSGQYSPGANEGRKLLAHELTHVLQQGSATPAIQRETAPVDVAATATDVEHLVRPGNDEKGALDKLKALDMAVLLKVVGQLYDDAGSGDNDEGKRRAYGLLNGDLAPAAAGAAATPGQSLTDDERARLKAAFDAAPTRKLRNPTDTDPGTNPTLSGSRNQSAATGPARPGDWGEDPSDNTWVAHTDGIRTYFASGIPSKLRTSTWLGNNPSNFDYTPSMTKRAIGSFHWGKGVHHFAIYLDVGDAAADLRERVKTFPTIISYIRAHLGNNAKDNNRSPEAYVKDMQRAAAVNENDATAAWTADDTKWASLIEGFKAAEGWKEGTTVSAANVKTLSSDPKDAKLIAYYQRLLGST